MLIQGLQSRGRVESRASAVRDLDHGLQYQARDGVAQAPQGLGMVGDLGNGYSHTQSNKYSEREGALRLKRPICASRGHTHIPNIAVS